ncbi:MAG: S8 family serine peptidase [Planctomycetota bacterium]
MPARLAAPLLPFILAAGCASAPNTESTAEPTAPTASQNQPAAAPAQPNATLAAFPASTEPEPDNAFADALQPKTETGVDRFLQQFPEADGRGVVVAIFDTGVDPAAPGMQVTTDGKPKIIDLVDASGSGDVDTSTVAELNDDGTVTGLSGRTLTLNPEWANPTGPDGKRSVRIGLKPATELFPRGLVGRVMSERSKDRMEEHRALVAEAKRALADFDAEHPEPTEDELEIRGDLQQRLDLLADMPDMIEDAGPMYDCVVWHDGEHWRAAVDTDEDGDLAEELAMTNFRTERQFGTFGDEDLLNFAVNIYNDGDILSIFTEAGAHGTHVAGTVAAHFPDQPELNGMAPGAQIVGVKIGDTRLGSSSVNTGLVRGITAVIDNDADMINMSYGGPGAFPDTRYRIDHLAAELVNEHNVVFVSSAGNSGPALSTVGSPGGSTGAIIGVGAAISAEMMEAQYAVREGWGDLQYPWSSRGPTLDGDLGVDISAPGGAISPVPSWTLNKHQLMNGTSMSSPNACGGIALILSKLKQEDIATHPAAIKRAVTETAVPLPGQSPWANGAGMLQVDAAYEHLVNYHDDRYTDVTFHARGPGNTRGIYLREPYETDEPSEISVSFRAEWLEDADNRRKTEFDMRLAIEATEPWIETASSHTLNAAGRNTNVRVDPTELEPGAHFAQILAFDDAHPERGPMFTFPVTVIKGIELSEDDGYTYRETITTSNGDLVKRFFHAPEGATWMDVIIERLDSDTSRTLVCHMTQLREEEAFVAHNSRNWLTFNDDDFQTRSMRVDGGRTVELALAQNWSSLGEGEFDITVRFRGVRPEPSMIMIDGAHYVTPMNITSPLRDANVRPSGSFTGLRRSIRPTDWTISALDSKRDMLPEGRQTYEIVLEYDLSMSEDGTVQIDPAASAVPHFWDEFESSLWRIYDKHNKPVVTSAGGDEDVELDEGDYTVEFHVRHHDPDMLIKLENSSLILTHEIKSVGINVARSPDAALNGSGNFGTRELDKGQTVRAYIATPTNLPDLAETGDVLLGSMTFGAATDLGGASSRPGGWPVAMRVAAKANDKPEIEAKDDDEDNGDEPTRTEELADEITDLKIAALNDLMAADEADEFEALAAELMADADARKDNELDVLLARMYRADALAESPTDDAEAEAEDANEEGEAIADAEPAEEEPAPEPVTPEDVIAAAQAVIAAIDTDALAAYNGVNHDKDADDFDEDLADEMAKQKDALTEALTLIVMTKIDILEDESGEDGVAAVEDAIADLERWGSLDDDDQGTVDMALAKAEGRLGDALAMVNAKIDDEPTRDLREQRIELLEELGWTVWANLERDRLIGDMPKFDPVF